MALPDFERFVLRFVYVSFWRLYGGIDPDAASICNNFFTFADNNTTDMNPPFGLEKETHASALLTEN